MCRNVSVFCLFARKMIWKKCIENLKINKWFLGGFNEITKLFSNYQIGLKVLGDDAYKRA